MCNHFKDNADYVRSVFCSLFSVNCILLLGQKHTWCKCISGKKHKATQTFNLNNWLGCLNCWSALTIENCFNMCYSTENAHFVSIKLVQIEVFFFPYSVLWVRSVFAERGAVLIIQTERRAPFWKFCSTRSISSESLTQPSWWFIFLLLDIVPCTREMSMILKPE